MIPIDRQTKVPVAVTAGAAGAGRRPGRWASDGPLPYRLPRQCRLASALQRFNLTSNLTTKPLRNMTKHNEANIVIGTYYLIRCCWSMCTDYQNKNRNQDAGVEPIDTANSSGTARLLPQAPTASGNADRTSANSSGARSPRPVSPSTSHPGAASGNAVRIALPASMRPSAPTLSGSIHPVLCTACKGALVPNASFCAFCGTVARNAASVANSPHAATLALAVTGMHRPLAGHVQ